MTPTAETARPSIKYRIPRAALAEAVAKEMKKRADANKLPRRVWYGPDKLRAAYLAGQGKSGDEIAQVIGGTNGARVRAMLSSHGIPMMRQAGNQDILFVKWKKHDREALEKAAAKRDRDPAELAALIVRKVLEGGDKAIDELVDQFDVIG